MFATLSDFHDALHDLPPANEAWRGQARERQTQLTKPPGSLGRLEECAIFLAGWGEEAVPRIEDPRIIVFAGNHGVTERGVSPFQPDVTEQMVANFAAGGAAINALAKSCGASLDVVPLALDRPTEDISRGAAMSEAASASLRIGCITGPECATGWTMPAAAAWAIFRAAAAVPR